MQPPLSSKKYFVVIFFLSSVLLAAGAFTLHGQGAPDMPAIATSVLAAVVALIAINLVILSLAYKNTKAEEKLRRSEELFSIIMRGVNDGLFDYNVATGAIYYSPSYKSMLGFSDTELGGMHDFFDMLVHPDDRKESRQVFQDYINGKLAAYNNEFRLRHKNGHYVWVLSRGVGVRDAQGRIQRLIGTHADISIQKQREEQLYKLMRENDQQRDELMVARDRAEAANCAKSDFLATMSHEIRTPMNAVIGLARLMRETPLNPKQQDMLETLSSSADMLLHLVNDVLDLNRIEAAQVEMETRPFALNDLLGAVHAMFQGQAAAKKLDLQVCACDGASNFIGDPMRIRQILVNLVGNALKFTDRGGITVVATCAGGREAEVTITVSDTGVGIPPEKLPVIFDKFVQADQTISRRFGGSGLGLAICKSLALLMGGDITVASTADQGSVFTVRLRLLRAAADTPAVNAALSMPGNDIVRGTALVVEDYPANVLVVTLMLQQLGYKADVASSGGEALSRIAARETPYDVVLMDVQMPDMDGFETTARLRALEKEKDFCHTVIGVTAHSLAGDRERCLAAGMDDYISKPIHPELLAEKLGQSRRAA